MAAEATETDRPTTLSNTASRTYLDAPPIHRSRIEVERKIVFDPDRQPLHGRPIVSARPSAPPHQRAQDSIQNVVETLAHILGQESQHEVAVFLQQGVLVAVPAVGIGIGQVLRAVQFHSHPRLRAEEVHFHLAPLVEGN